MTVAKASAAYNELIQAPLSDLKESPSNARRTFDAAALAELAASIREHGIQVPLVVRVNIAGPEMFEIVCGHRRLRAAAAAGLTEVPVIVRKLDDAQAREIGIVDNLQREDLPPMEEAEAFGKLLTSPQATIESVAAILAKPPSYIGRRVQLLKSVEPVRDALKAGAIEVGHALELARLGEKKQIELLSWLDCGYIVSKADAARFDEEADEDFEDDFDDEREDEPSGWRPTRCSVANLRKRIAETTLRVLASAPFPLDDEIAPLACTDCPKRSGNAQLLFDDCAQDTCTDRECYDAKIAAWIETEIKAAKDQKRKLITVSAGYSREKGVYAEWDVARFDKKGKCEHGVDAIWISGEQAGHRLTVCIDEKCKKHHGGSSYSSPEPSAKHKAERKKKLEKLNAERKYRARCSGLLPRLQSAI